MCAKLNTLKAAKVLVVLSILFSLSQAIAKEPLKSDKKYVGTPEQIELYTDECAACHTLFKPDLMPRHTWKRMMITLEEHFGTDAYLEEEDRVVIEEYLLKNASNDCKAVDARSTRQLEVQQPKKETKELPFFERMLGSDVEEIVEDKKVEICDYKHNINSNKNFTFSKKVYCVNCHIQK